MNTINKEALDTLFTKPIPSEISFEATKNKILFPYLKRAFLSTLLLSKDDMRRGYIEIHNVKFILYITDEVKELLCNANNSFRITTIASFQTHTNNASIVLCKLKEPFAKDSKRHQHYYEALKAIKNKQKLEEAFK